MPAVLRPFLSRFLGPWVTAVFLWVGAKIGHQYDVGLIADATALVVEGLIWSLAAFVSMAGVIHRAMDRKLNPTDSAAPDLAEMGAKP